VSKKMEGNEEQRRRAALDAEQAGERPSARKATLGASKQLGTHRPDRVPTTSGRRGKQREQAEERDLRPPPPEPPPGRTFQGRGRPEYGADHARVFQALGEAERRHGGEAVYAEEVARTAGLPPDRTRDLLHDLVTTHRLATELQRTDRPDLGTRYETRPGR
jgi:hypothetical protein